MFDEVEADTTRRRIAPIIAAGCLLVVGALIVMLIAGTPGGGEPAESPLLGKFAPAVTGDNADGSEFVLSHRKGSWVVINFFNVTCIPCIAEHPDLIEFVEQQRSLGNEGAEFYSIVIDSAPAEVDEFFAEYGGDWPVVYDNRHEFATGFGVVQQPETWIIDPNGVVQIRMTGQIDNATALSRELQELREMLG